MAGEAKEKKKKSISGFVQARPPLIQVESQPTGEAEILAANKIKVLHLPVLLAFFSHHWKRPGGPHLQLEEREKTQS